MENPMTWTRAEHVVAEALEQHRKDMLEGVIGLSHVRTVTDALRREGLLVSACGCPTNEAGDIRCHTCGEYVNKRCWNCGTPRGEGPCPAVSSSAIPPGHTRKRISGFGDVCAKDNEEWPCSTVRAAAVVSSSPASPAEEREIQRELLRGSRREYARPDKPASPATPAETIETAFPKAAARTRAILNAPDSEGIRPKPVCRICALPAPMPSHCRKCHGDCGFC